MVLCSRSFAQLRATFQAYAAIAGHDIEQAISSETSGDLQAGYLAVGKCRCRLAAASTNQRHSRF